MKQINSAKWRGFTPAAVTVLLAPLILCSFLAVLVQFIPAPRSGAAPSRRAALRNGSLGVRVGWYIRSGQWRGDIRTLGSLVAYVVRPEAPSRGSARPIRAAQAERDGNTNVSLGLVASASDFGSRCARDRHAVLAALAPTQSWTCRFGSNSPAHVFEWQTHS